MYDTSKQSKYTKDSCLSPLSNKLSSISLESLQEIQQYMWFNMRRGHVLP